MLLEVLIKKETKRKTAHNKTIQ